MEEINKLSLTALLLDTITHIKFKAHLVPNFIVTKQLLCKYAGQKKSISSKKLLHLIGLVYRDNGIEMEFWETIDRYEMGSYFE